LANALVQNCSINLKVEVASRPFLTSLQKLLSNPKTHPAVKDRVLDLIQSWAESFRGESQLDFMVETYRQLASEGKMEYDARHWNTRKLGILPVCALC
jgi:growth factor-regulated tyrosine kinase substrate